MGAWEKGTYTDPIDYIGKLRLFLAANGWTIDFNGTWTTYTRIHFHLGSLHYDMIANSTVIYIYICTDYVSGNDPSSQPGGGGKYISITSILNNSNYIFIATAVSIYFSNTINYSSYTGYRRWCGLGVLTNKIGNWNGGQWLQAPTYNDWLFSTTAYTTMHCIVLVDDVFYGNSAVSPNCLAGTMGSNENFKLTTPNAMNQGIVPIPTLALLAASDSVFFKPAAYVDDLYGVYCPYHKEEDILTIGGSDYILFSRYNPAGIPTNEYSYMFKIS